MENRNKKIFTIEEIKSLVKPVAEKYHADKVYLFGSYARGEADEESDLDFLVFGGKNFKPTHIFALAEEFYENFNKRIDAFEICEVNQDSDFFKTVMKEKVLVAWNT